MFTEVFDPNGYGFGPCLLKYEEIRAYSISTRTMIHPNEVMILRGLSELYLTIDHKRNKRAGDAPMKNVTSMNDNAGLKAMFARAGTTKKSKPAAKE